MLFFYYILVALYTFSGVQCKEDKEVVEVLLWSGGTWAGFGSGATWSAPNYLGQTVTKQECPVDCRYTGNKGRTGQADAIIFEAQPLASYGDEYLRKPISFPQRRPGQYFINFGYEQQFYFPLYAEPGFLALQDINMTYDQKGAVPITFTCSWGGGSIDDFLKPHPKKSKGIAFMASNCGGGGASFRTIYLKELMKHLQVDSLGGCMRNTKLPADMSKPVYEDHGTSQRWKIEIFKDYKYVLTFENNNVTDYVTEKLPAAFLAGALPIYMGAPNIDSWLPGKKSVIKTDDFSSPKELADYIKHLNDNDDEYEEYFAWKKEGLSDNFKDKYQKCVFYNSECRLCEKIAEMKKARAIQNVQLNQNFPESTKYGEGPELLSRGYALTLNGNAYVEVPHDERLSEISQEFTLAAWIRIGKAQSMRIIDKSTTETSDGFSLDVQYIGSSHYVRLCAGFRCVVGTRPVSMDTWYYVTAVFGQGHTGVQIYLNGFRDVTAPMFAAASHNDRPIRFGSPAAGSSDIFVGKLDDVSIWKIALDEITIRRNAFARMTGNENGLVGYWSFNEGSGTTVSDWSVNARHGTIQGTASWEDADLKPLTLNPCW